MMTDRNVHFALNHNEALVLFEFLSRFSEKETLTIEDQAEEQALNNLLCVLETMLSEPFMPNYLELLENARKALRSCEITDNTPNIHNE